MAAGKTREERLFGAACLKLSLERGGHGAAGSEIYRATLEDLELSEAEVETYLEAHRERVAAAMDSRRPSSKSTS